MRNVSSTEEDRTVEAYFSDVRGKALLSADYEKKLFEAYRTCAPCGYVYTEGAQRKQCPTCAHPRDFRSRDKIVEGALRFVIKEAKSYARKARGHDYGTSLLTALISAGNLGLLLAVDRFDLSRGTRFLTYAVHWIRLKIREELDNMGVIRVPTYRQKALRARRKRGGDVGADEIPVMEEVASVKNRSNGDDLEKEFSNNWSESLLYEAFDVLQLRGRDRYIILAYFGVRDTPRNLGYISEQLNLSSERVRVIKKQVTEKLRGYFEGLSLERIDDILTE